MNGIRSVTQLESQQTPSTCQGEIPAFSHLTASYLSAQLWPFCRDEMWSDATTAWAKYAEKQCIDEKLIFPGKNYVLSYFMVQ